MIPCGAANLGIYSKTTWPMTQIECNLTEIIMNMKYDEHGIKVYMKQHLLI